ncbi:MAG TPA: DUF4234 domain-containing protein [Myxococcales bacterium]|jgi:hypothetical protein
MTRRNPAIVLLLTLVTCTIYWFYWIYVTTDELKQTTGKADLNPALDVVLSIVTCGIWGIYVEYRNAQLVHETLDARGVRHEDRSVVILILNLASFFVGVTGLIAIVLLQDELNKLAPPATP